MKYLKIFFYDGQFYLNTFDFPNFLVSFSIPKMSILGSPHPLYPLGEGCNISWGKRGTCINSSNYVLELKRKARHNDFRLLICILAGFFPLRGNIVKKAVMGDDYFPLTFEIL